MNRVIAVVVVVSALSASTSFAATIVNPTEDVMTSAFFFGPNFVRGYAGEGRAVFRVSSDNAFGSGPETIYLQFNPADFAGFGGPVASAVLTMQSTDGGFGANADAANPFNVSAHAVNADPIASITDDTNPGGPIAWDDFFANNILPASAAATTAVNGFGPFEFDVTGLVNDWIAGTNTVFSLALTGKNDVQVGNGFLHGFLNNTETPGSTFLTINQVPEPYSLALGLCCSLALAGWMMRMPRQAHRLH